MSEDAPQDAAVGPFATVTWDGTSDECSSVSCRDAAVLGQFQMLAAEGDSPTLTVLIEYPGGDAITGVTASADGASGSLTLGPDEDTAAPQMNPEARLRARLRLTGAGRSPSARRHSTDAWCSPVRHALAALPPRHTA